MSTVTNVVRRRAIVPVVVDGGYQYYNVLARDLDEARAKGGDLACREYPGCAYEAVDEREVRWVV
ncbi:MAG: hypothetical protein RL077_341 [Verrucomicrobiota bacterium]|jgi:hypothetical protein